jgi:Uncharacterized protein conserved in bacteria
MDMKDTLRYYARCNAAINAAMIETIEKAGLEPFELELSGYFFKTLGAILEHVYVSDLNWLKTFTDLVPYGTKLAADFGPLPAYGDKLFSSLAEYKEARLRLDRFIEDYAVSIDDELLSKSVSRQLRDGTRLERDAGKALVHFFNHQTHHRGQVSCVLDELKVENNYSNMIYFD